MAGGEAAGASARLQLPHAVVHLDSRSLSRPFSAFPAPAQGGVEGPEVHDVLAGVVRGRLGALLRADDGGVRVSPAGPDAQARTACRVADSPGAIRREHPAARRRYV